MRLSGQFWVCLFFLGKVPRCKTNDFRCLRSFYEHENLLPLLLLFACFRFVGWFWFVLRFCVFKIFSLKKINRLEIGLITTYYTANRPSKVSQPFYRKDIISHSKVGKDYLAFFFFLHLKSLAKYTFPTNARFLLNQFLGQIDIAH